MNLSSTSRIFWLGIVVTAYATLVAIGLGAWASVHAAGNEDAAARVQHGSNAYAAGGAVRVAEPVAGDFFIAGGRVTLDAPVAGDVLAVGGSVSARGQVGDDLRIAGGDVSVENKVGGELLAVGGNVLLTPQALIEHGATIGGGQVTIEGKVVGTLTVRAQRVTLNGEVTGDARLSAESIELGPKARIGGNLSYASRDMHRAESTTISGTVVRDESGIAVRDDRRPDSRHEWQWQLSGTSWAVLVFEYLGLLAAGVALVLLFPGYSARAPEAIRRSPLLSLAIGLGVMAGIPALAVLFLISLLGIPLGIATFALYPLLLLLGYLSGVLFVAQRARRRLRGDRVATFSATVGFVALALLIVMLVGLLPVIGPLAMFATTIAGLGACVLQWHRHRQGSHPAAGL